MLSGDDMLQVESHDGLMVGMEQAVLTTMAGPLNDEPAQSRIHQAAR